MTRIESTGKTIEEAISAGLAKLGCSISDVTLEILEEGSKGLFGLFGSRQAKVRLTLNDDEEITISNTSLFSNLTLETEAVKKPAPRPEPQAERRPEPKKPAPEKPTPTVRQAVEQSAPKPQPAPAPERAKPMDRPQADRPAPQARPARVEDKLRAPRPPMPPRPAVMPDTPAEQFDPTTPAGCAQAFLREVTRLMGVTVSISARTDEEGHLYVDMFGDTLGILIGRRGETLDSLQYLTRLQVNRLSEQYIRVTLDTENYRSKREEALRRFASRTASRVVKTGRKVVLEPMNPYERRILHAALQGHPSVTTHSEGDEPNRHVVVTLKKDAPRAAENVEKPYGRPVPIDEVEVAAVEEVVDQADDAGVEQELD